MYDGSRSTQYRRRSGAVRSPSATTSAWMVLVKIGSGTTKAAHSRTSGWA